MDIVKEKFKWLSEILSVSRILSAYTLSSVVKFPKGERFQVNLNTYVRCLAKPANPIGNVLILQGGAKHMNSNSYYIRTIGSLISKNVRLFIFEKILPVVGYQFSHDVAEVVDYIKTNFPGPLSIIGYSMGGILLFSYLAMGYDQADLYIPCCCPLDLPRFQKVLADNSLFKMLEKKTYNSYHVDGYDELLDFVGCSSTEQKEFEKTFISRLNSQTGWLDKTVYVLSSDDPLTSSDDLKLLQKKPFTYYIQGGWHCCLDSILLTALLANRYIQAKAAGKEIKLEDIDVTPKLQFSILQPFSVN